MSSFAVAVVGSGSALHVSDLQSLQKRYGAVPHQYRSWPIHSTIGSWRWCRILGADRHLVTGFAVHLTSSRALPGTHIGRVECLGRALHESIDDSLGEVLREAAMQIPRVLRLDIHIFDENAERRRALTASLTAAGFAPTRRRRQYSHTLLLPLDCSEEALLRGFSKRVRSTIRKAINSPLLRFGAVAGDHYECRLGYLHTLPFRRTGGIAPPIDVTGILRDSFGGHNSLLIGAFVRDRKPPDDLVGFAWARLHGDYAALEINASERCYPFSNTLSPGFGLMWRLFTWARGRGAKWLDLGGLPCIDARSDDPMRGIIEFKTRFSTNLLEVAEEWQFEPHPLLTGAAAATRRVASLVRRIDGSPG
jgi:hypothetical protein